MKHFFGLFFVNTVLVVSVQSAAHAAEVEGNAEPSASNVADSAAATDSASPFDVEVDPLAYVARGYSLHLGARVSRLRFDFGSFGLLVPQFVHGQEGFEAQMDGYGVKLDVYLAAPSSGPFVGVEGSWLHQEIIDEETQIRAEAYSVQAGGRFGWEFKLGSGFYAKPWVGIGHSFGKDNVAVAGKTFQQSSLLIFPTVHLGYVFP